MGELHSRIALFAFSRNVPGNLNTSEHLQASGSRQRLVAGVYKMISNSNIAASVGATPDAVRNDTELPNVRMNNHLQHFCNQSTVEQDRAATTQPMPQQKASRIVDSLAQFEQWRQQVERIRRMQIMF